MQRDSKGRFVKGKQEDTQNRQEAANTFDTAVREMALHALNVLTEAMDDPETSATLRVRAAETLIERAFGKPQQRLQPQGEPVRIVDDVEDE